MTEKPAETVPYYRPARPNSYALSVRARQIADTKMVTNGPMCREFEEEVRDFYGARYAISCISCTVGLYLALRALRSLTGAKSTYLPSFTWYSTELAVEAAGMNRVFVDSDPNGWMMEPCGDKDQIVMPVSTFGAHVDVGQYQGSVLVDGAHMFGTFVDWTKVAGVVLSFSPSKVLTCGEGGMLLTEFSEVASKFEELRNKFGRMSELSAAMGLCHWDGLDAYFRDRKIRWKRYAEKFKRPQKFEVSNYSIFGARVPERKKLQDFLLSKGIETKAYYTPLVDGLKNSDQLGKEVLCLPNYYGCPTEKVIAALREFGKDPI